MYIPNPSISVVSTISVVSRHLCQQLNMCPRFAISISIAQFKSLDTDVFFFHCNVSLLFQNDKQLKGNWK